MKIVVSALFGLSALLTLVQGKPDKHVEDVFKHDTNILKTGCVADGGACTEGGVTCCSTSHECRVKICRESKFPYTLMKLPYGNSSLVPFISEETINYHYGKHHAGYVNNMNTLRNANMAELGDKSIEYMMYHPTDQYTYNQAAQTWNHDFYWKSMKAAGPAAGGVPKDATLLAKINAKWGSFDAFKLAFVTAAVAHFGSGWAWLVVKGDLTLDIVTTHDATNPMMLGLGRPLLVCDVWEHAYYIDTRNARTTYVGNWFNLVNWPSAADKLIDTGA